MKTYLSIRTYKQIIDKVFCNKCTREVPYLESHLEIDYTFGYGSTQDEKNIKFDLCESCLTKLITKFKITSEDG